VTILTTVARTMADVALASPTSPPDPFPMLTPYLPYAPLAGVIVAGVSLVVAILALRSSRGSRKIAARALLLSETADERTRHPIVASLLDGEERIAATGDRRIEVRVLVRNPASVPNTLEMIELRVSYTVAGRATTMLVALSATQRPDALSSPLVLGAASSMSGWCGFDLPATLSSGWVIEDYDLAGLDVHGNAVEVPRLVLRRIR